MAFLVSQPCLLFFAVLVLLLALHGVPQAAAIQVTPNSPCASLCIDNSSLDTSDPNSSNTETADLSCQDNLFSSTATGKKWSSCMGCLQNSTSVQGAESDQAWFFYNLRYNFDYCIFGYPNGSEAASSPCQTSTACGPLLDSLTKGIPNMGSESEFSYCDFVDGSNATSASFDACMSCISASSSSNILTNSLIALQAGCQQKLPDNEAVGLSGSVFVATSIISIVSPTASSNGSGSSDMASGTSGHVSMTTIAIIVVVALLVVAAVSGFVVVCLHKRKRAQGRRPTGAAGQDGGGAAEKTAGTGGSGGNGIGPVRWASSVENITSPLSFQCRADRTSSASFATTAATSLHSMAAVSPQGQELSWQQQQKQQQQKQQQQAAMGSVRKKHGKPQQLQQQTLEADSSGTHLAAIAESPFPSPAGATTSGSPTRPGPPARPAATALPRLYQLKTSFGPPGNSARNSGRYDNCSSGTPTSATALLSHPASGSSAALSRHSSPASASTAMTPSSAGGLAPYIPSAYIPGSSVLQPSQPPQPPQQRSHQTGASPQSIGRLPAWSSAAAAVTPPHQKHRRAESNEFGSPVDSRATRIAFPPPPQRRDRR